MAAQLFGGLSNFTVQTGCSTLLVAPIRTSETGSVTGWPGGSVDRASDSRSTVAERPEVRTQSASGAQEKVVRGFFPSRKCCAGLTRCRPVGTTVAFVSKYTQPHSLSMTSVVQPPGNLEMSSTPKFYDGNVIYRVRRVKLALLPKVAS